MRIRPLFASLLASIALTACLSGPPAGDRPDQPGLNADFGNALRANAALHIIDPQPSEAESGAPLLAGPRAAAAMQRYQSGTVPPAEAEPTGRRTGL